MHRIVHYLLIVNIGIDIRPSLYSPTLTGPYLICYHIQGWIWNPPRERLFYKINIEYRNLSKIVEYTYWIVWANRSKITKSDPAIVPPLDLLRIMSVHDFLKTQIIFYNNDIRLSNLINYNSYNLQKCTNLWKTQYG